MAPLNRSLVPILAVGLILLVGGCNESLSGADTPVFVVSPTSLLFDGTIPGETEVQSVLVENHGAGALVISSSELSGSDAFSLGAADRVDRLRIAPGAAAEITVVYTAPVGGDDTSEPADAAGMLVLRHNDPERDPTAHIPILARAGRGRLFVTPNPINFGHVSGGRTASVRVVLSNVGDGPLTLDTVFVVGGNGVFTIDGGELDDAELVVHPDERYELGLTFEPVDDGVHNGRLIIISDDPSEPQGRTAVEIVGNGAEPCIELIPSDDGAYDFGVRPIGRTAEAAFRVRNCGDVQFGEALVVSEIGLLPDSGPAYALSGVPSLPLELSPGEDAVFVVEYAPDTDATVEYGTLRVTSNDPFASQIDVALTGVGTREECSAPRVVCTIDGRSDPPASDLFTLPLDTVTCWDTAYDAENVAEYIWSVAERPDGSTAEFVPEDEARTSFFVDLAGRFVFHVEVVTPSGCVTEPAIVTLVSRPGGAIHVELTWSTPRDPDRTDLGFGAGSDVDLHFLHPNGCWEDLTHDCHFRARTPPWGGDGLGDDPSLDIDDTDGWGPENVTLDEPENGAVYRVGVHYYDDHGYGVSFATVRIRLFGTLVFEARDREMPYTDAWWVVAAIHWPSAEVTPVDLFYDDVPGCFD